MADQPKETAVGGITVEDLIQRAEAGDTLAAEAVLGFFVLRGDLPQADPLERHIALALDRILEGDDPREALGIKRASMRPKSRSIRDRNRLLVAAVKAALQGDMAEADALTELEQQGEETMGLKQRHDVTPENRLNQEAAFDRVSQVMRECGIEVSEYTVRDAYRAWQRDR